MTLFLVPNFWEMLKNLNFSNIFEMALKRRSFSTVSNFSVSTVNQPNYRHLTDLSPEIETKSIDSPKKQRLFLKKANLNFIKRKKELKTSSSTSNLTDEKLFFEKIEKRPMSDPIGKCQIFPEKKNCLLYSSFCFGKDRFLKKNLSKKELAPKFAYRCVLHASNWTNGSDWEFLGSSEVVPLAIEENESHFSFVSPFEVKYDYDADTSLKFELQRARLAEKSGTFSMTPSSNLLEKPRKWKLEIPENLKFVTIGSICCDLNGLLNRGSLNTKLIMKSELGPDCSIYVGAEMSNQDLNQTKSFNFHFSARQRFDENNVRLFSTEMAYRVLISRYFDRAEAFVPVFKSHVFGLSLKASLYQTQIVLELTHQNFAKIDGFFRFALIEAASEKCLCFGDLRGSPFFDQQVEIPITEANFNSFEMRHGQQNIFYTITPGIGFFRLRRNSDPKTEVVDSMIVAPTSSNLSRNVSINEKTINSVKIPKKSSREESERDSERSSKTESFVSDVEMEDDPEDTIIVNGHTQAYLMSLLLPNKKIYVREIFPDHENICEFRR